MDWKRARSLLLKTSHWLLLVVVILYIVSGFGISHFRVVETITFGLLTKNLSFRIHDVLWIPFIVLLLVHIGAAYIFKPKKR